MPRQTLSLDAASVPARFANGTTVESGAAAGSITQFTPAAPGLRSIELPAELDTNPAFEKALQELGIHEQETIHVDAQPGAAGLRGPEAQDEIVVRPAIPAGDPNPRVILYADESGGLSWHFAEGSLLTEDQRERMRRRGLRADAPATPEFRIAGRTAAARATIANGLPRPVLRGPITKIGRKVLKILVVPLVSAVSGPLVAAIVDPIEKRYRQNRIWQVTPDNYAKTPAPEEFTNWSTLDGKPTLLLVHGIFSSVNGMLSGLPRDAMQRWCEFYAGRVIAFDHLSVTLSPEDNARYLLEQAKNAVPQGNFHFDIVCHSRGGIVSRTLAERGRTLMPDSNCDFRSVYFAASPNHGCALGDPDHMLEMIDVFTNLLTNFPDGPVLYSIEVLLAIVKLLAHSAERNLPGIASMGTKGYISDVLNAATEVSPARYAAAASGYQPMAGKDNGFFTGAAGTQIMSRIFGGNANDLVVPRDGVFAGNNHPSFPISNTLVFRPEQAVWHTAFFTRKETIEHIETHLGVRARIELNDPILGGGMRGGMRGAAPGGYAGAAPAAAFDVAPAAEIQREPYIDFHELMVAGQTSPLVVRLDDPQASAALDNLLSLQFAAGQDSVALAVELSAPGFTVIGARTASVTVERRRDPAKERVEFQLKANDPGLAPVVRHIVASFYQENNCVGAVTHLTTVVPHNYAGPVNASGQNIVSPIVFGRPRECADVVVYIRTLSPDRYELSVRCQLQGQEYDQKPFGILELSGTEFSDFFAKTIDPQFGRFPSDPNLSDADFDSALKAWNKTFQSNLDSLGAKLWTYLPAAFQQEYFRLMALPVPPRSILIHSDEMILPWELVVPRGTWNGNWVEYPALGVSHVLGRWKPGLAARPQPQSLPIKHFVALNPQYGQSKLYWAEQETKALDALIPNIEKPTPVNLDAVNKLLDRGDVQIVHYNGHGDWSASADLSALRLENGESAPALAFTQRRLGNVAHPILYLNACTVGRGSVTVGRAAGFVANCLDGGWSGVIAPYWPVYDPSAKEFSVQLYTKLCQGRAIGEALQELRREHPGDVTTQSYSYFGDPWARVLFAQ